jgi:hypothetical protein
MVPEVVKIPERSALVLDGAGGPESVAFRRGVAAVYRVAHALARRTAERGQPIAVGPLETRWCAENDLDLRAAPRERWCWQLRLSVPDDVRDCEVALAVVAAAAERERLKEVGHVHLERLPAERVCRGVHRGPRATEDETLAAIDRAAIAGDLVPTHAHVEIRSEYPRRTRSERFVLLRELA